MGISDDAHRLLTLCALEHPAGRIDWSLIAREAVRFDGLDRLWGGQMLERSSDATKALPLLRDALATDVDRARARVDVELDSAAAVGADLVTVLDGDAYPANLRLVPNLPPFLFTLGSAVQHQDIRAVAVVGTRDASVDGIDAAGLLARLLAEHQVTVVSGLAAGIDTAAHRATLDAGGRTIAVIGTGITRSYPRQNQALQTEIAERGTVVSQFWPSSPPATWTFPRRNVVTSGISQGTVVIEATSTSGAKMQARLALEHGKRVFLVHKLVTRERWAQDYVAKRGAIEVRRVEDVIDRLAEPDRISNAVEDRLQLSFDIL
jgi:DNA processing protein